MIRNWYMYVRWGTELQTPTSNLLWMGGGTATTLAQVLWCRSGDRTDTDKRTGLACVWAPAASISRATTASMSICLYKFNSTLQPPQETKTLQSQSRRLYYTMGLSCLAEDQNGTSLQRNTHKNYDDDHEFGTVHTDLNPRTTKNWNRDVHKPSSDWRRGNLVHP